MTPVLLNYEGVILQRDSPESPKYLKNQNHSRLSETGRVANEEAPTFTLKELFACPLIISSKPNVLTLLQVGERGEMSPS